VGLIQNAVTHPTTAPFVEQLRAIRTRVRELLDAAGAAGCKIVCLQEAWTMPFAFCTREKQVRRPALALLQHTPLEVWFTAPPHARRAATQANEAMLSQLKVLLRPIVAVK
jgi:endonuclease/exonuclease/phosphatase family metal-dependent hydrolase